MRFEWDEAKNRKNFKKHGIAFETAVLVFDDPNALSFQDRATDDEERWQIFRAVYGSIIMVAHVWREENEGEVVIRVISARSASSYEEGIYEAHKKSG